MTVLMFLNIFENNHDWGKNNEKFDKITHSLHFCGS